jgi:hypothetical protein
MSSGENSDEICQKKLRCASSQNGDVKAHKKKLRMMINVMPRISVKLTTAAAAAAACENQQTVSSK